MTLPLVHSSTTHIYSDILSTAGSVWQEQFKVAMFIKFASLQIKTYKHKDSHILNIVTCVNPKLHQLTVKSLFYLKPYIIQEIDKWQSCMTTLPASH